MTQRVSDYTDDVHASCFPWKCLLWRRSAVHRIAFMTQRVRHPFASYMLALVTLQRIFRGVLVRMRIVRKYYRILAHGVLRSVDGAESSMNTTSTSVSARSSSHTLSPANTSIFLRSVRNSQNSRKSPPDSSFSNSSTAAASDASDTTFRRLWRSWDTTITMMYHDTRIPDASHLEALARRVQARWRMILFRGEYQRWSDYARFDVYSAAATRLQHWWLQQFDRVLRPRKEEARRILEQRKSERFPSHYSDDDVAAARIQICFRRLLRRKIFQYYVNLIRSRERSDPRELLRCINPLEAGLFDRSTQLYVRFRFGGTRFPPIVFYKIFTHGAVTDVCAMAPKNYARERRKKRSECYTHLSVVPNATQRDRHGWYARWDRNDWRPVSDYVLTHAEEAMRAARSHHLASQRSYPKQSPFHYSKMRRRVDQEVHHRARRREWLVELYTHEQLAQPTAAQNPLEKRRTLRDEATELFATLSDADVDHEVQRLLQWTSHLDYFRYRLDWMGHATSGTL